MKNISIFILSIIFIILNGCAYSPTYEIHISSKTPNIEKISKNEFEIVIHHGSPPTLGIFRAYLTADGSSVSKQKIRWYSDIFENDIPYKDVITNDGGISSLNFYINNEDIGKTFTFRARHIDTNKDQTITLSVMLCLRSSTCSNETCIIR